MRVDRQLARLSPRQTEKEMRAGKLKWMRQALEKHRPRCRSVRGGLSPGWDLGAAGFASARADAQLRRPSPRVFDGRTVGTFALWLVALNKTTSLAPEPFTLRETKQCFCLVSRFRLVSCLPPLIKGCLMHIELSVH